MYYRSIIVFLLLITLRVNYIATEFVLCDIARASLRIPGLRWALAHTLQTPVASEPVLGPRAIWFESKGPQIWRSRLPGTSFDFQPHLPRHISVRTLTQALPPPRWLTSSHGSVSLLGLSSGYFQ